MKEYKVIDLDTPKKMEGIMNQMAMDFWEVKDVCYFESSMSRRIIVTFEREKR